MKDIDYQWFSYEELTTDLLYEILRLRQDVFVVEQNCVYQDADGVDQKSYHLIAHADQGSNDIVAYLRVIIPTEHDCFPKIGRVLVTFSARGKGFGKAIMEEAVRKITDDFPASEIHISGQCYLQEFYQDLGFLKASEPYDEDGILHIDMVKSVGVSIKSMDETFEIVDCLNSLEMTAFANDVCTEEEKQRYLLHVGGCQECSEKWSSLMLYNMKEMSSSESRGVVYFFSYPVHVSVVALSAAVIALFFSLLYFYM